MDKAKQLTKKHIGLITIISSLVVSTFLIMNKPVALAEQKKEELPYVETMMILPRSTNATIASQGIIQPESELTMLSELSSRIEWVSNKMEPGSSFEKGDTLIILDKRDYELALINAESQVLNAEVNLERELAEAELAEIEWKRVGAGSGSSLTLRKPQMAQAKAMYAAAKAKLEQAKRNLSRTVCIAPFTGRVRNSSIDEGTIVFPGTPLGNIYSTSIYEIRLPVADQDIFFIGLEFNGKQIPESIQPTVTFNLANEKFQGRVIRTEAEVDPRTKMRSLVARIDNIGETKSRLVTVGQFVQAEISGIEIDEIFVLPRNLVRDRSVWVVDSNRTIFNRPVNVIRYENEFALIDEGLNNGDRLLITRLSSLINGKKVTFELN